MTYHSKVVAVLVPVKPTVDEQLEASRWDELDSLPGLPIVEMNNPLLREAADMAADFGLRGADSVYAAAAKRLGIPLLTFDVEQKTRLDSDRYFKNLEEDLATPCRNCM